MSLTRKKGRLVTKGFFCYMTFYGKFCGLISSLILYVTKEPSPCCMVLIDFLPSPFVRTARALFPKKVWKIGEKFLGTTGLDTSVPFSC